MSRARAVVALTLAAALVAGCTSGGERDDVGRAPTTGWTCPAATALGCPLRRSEATIPILGTSLRLEYRSDRAPGRAEAPRDDARRLGLGGWALDIQDSYDADHSVYRTGSGDIRVVEAIGVGDKLLVASADGRTVAELTSDGRHVATTHALTGVVQYRLLYDDEHRLTGVVDRHDREVSIERDDRGVPLAIVADGAVRTSLLIGEDGWLTGVVDPAGGRTSIQYADGGLLTSMTDHAGRTTTFAYDDDGRLRVATDALGRTTTFAGDDGGLGSDVTITSPSGRELRWQVAEDDGAVRVVIAAGDQEIAEASSGDELTLETAWGRVVVRLADDPRFGAHARYVARLDREGARRSAPMTTARSASLERDDDPRSASTFETTVTAGTETSTARFDRETRTLTVTDAAGATRVTTFDERGDVVTVVRPGLAPLTIAYDGRGRPVASSQGGRRSTIAWDDDLGDVVVTDAAGGATRLAADARGALASVVRPDGRRLSIERTPAGDVSAVRVDGTQVLTQAFAATGDLLARGAGTGLAMVTRELDANGLTSALRIGDESVGTSYEDGLLAGLELPEGEISVTRDAAGRPTRIDDAVSGLTREVITDDGVAVGVTWSGVVDAALRWDVDENGRVRRDVVAAGDHRSAIDYRYDDAGRVVEAGGLSVEYDDAGRPSTTTLGMVRTERAWDDRGLLVSERHLADGRVVHESSYGYDLLGRMTTRSVSSNERPPVVTTYHYDVGGHLTGASVDGEAAYQYAYDLLDRLTSITTPQGTELVSYGADGRVQRRGDTEYQWSATGVLQGIRGHDGSVQVLSDALGRYAGAVGSDGTASTFVLDEDGNVAATTTGGTTQRFVYDEDDRIVAELDADGRIVRRFVYEGRARRPAYVVTDRGTYRIVRDAAGNPIGAIDVATGRQVETIEYDALGRETRIGEAVLPFGYGDSVALPIPGVQVQPGGTAFDTGLGTPLIPTVIWIPPGSGAGPAAPGGVGAGGAFGSGGAMGGGGGIGGGGAFAGGGGFGMAGHLGLDVPSWAMPALGGGAPLPTTPVPSFELAQGVLGSPFAPLAEGVFQLFGDPDFIGGALEGVGGGLGALRSFHDAGSFASGSLRVLGTLAGAAGLFLSARDLIQDLPKLFDPTLTGWARTEHEAKTLASVLALAPSLFGALGVEIPAVLVLTMSGLAVAAAAAAAVYLGIVVARSFGVIGDPHVTDTAGELFDFHGLGEYVLARAPDRTFEVQVRHAPIGTDRRLAVVGGVAIGVGGARVVIDVGTSPPLYVDRRPVDLPSGRYGLPDGEVRRLGDGTYLVWASDGSASVAVRPFHDHLDVSVGTTFDDSLVGLAASAATTRDGVVVDRSPGDFTAPLYAVLGESWRVRPEERLFDGTPVPVDREHPVAATTADDLPIAARRAAELLCRDAAVSTALFQACVLDVAATGDTSYVSSTRSASEDRRRAEASESQSGRASERPGRRPERAGSFELGDELRGDVDAGSADVYTFDVGEGIDGIVVVPGDTCGSGSFQVLDRDDDIVITETFVCEGGRLDLPAGGSYRARITGGETGDYAVRVLAAPRTTFDEATVGDRIDGELDEMGERHVYRLDVRRGDAIFVDTPQPAGSCDLGLRVLAPDGDALARGGACAPIGRVLIEHDGEHELIVETGLAVGPYRLAVVASSRDERIPMKLDVTATGAVDRPGARDIYEITVASGTELLVRGLGGDCSVTVRPFEAGGRSLQGLGYVCSDLPFTAPQSGRVEIVIEAPPHPERGEYSIRLEEV